jgi:hypothetical protein
MSIFLNNRMWASEQWQNATLGDKRRNARALKLAESILINPSASLPKQTECWSSLKAGYRFLNNTEVTHEKLQKDHYNNVMNSAQKSKKTILLIQDKSKIDLTSKEATKGIGSIGDHRGKGIIIQSILAVEFEKQWD